MLLTSLLSTIKVAIYFPAGLPVKSSIRQKGDSFPTLLFRDSDLPDGPFKIISALRIFSPPVDRIRNGSPGAGFFGKTRRVLTELYSSVCIFSLTESGNRDDVEDFFKAGRLPDDPLQLINSGIIRKMISKRILIPYMICMIDIFDLKIT